MSASPFFIECGVNDDYAVSTGSGSDRVSIRGMVELVKDNHPVATARGTDLIA